LKIQSLMLAPLGMTLLLLAIPPAATAQSHSWNVRKQPDDLVNGSPVLFQVKAPERLVSLEGSWLEHQISFRFDRCCNCWYAIAGVGLNIKPAEYPLKLAGNTVNGGKVHFSQPERINEGTYPSTTITVSPQYVEPPKETLPRIEEEQVIKKKVFSESSPESLWQGRFRAPSAAKVTGVFGAARVYNGTKRSQHEGIDFRVRTGTPIHAANAGTVVLARGLYFEGNCVMLDHGQGLMTVYMHLSKFKVKEGDKVQAGQVLGLSGGTGRATAPHLHFAVRWQGEYVNPAVLLRLSPP
jgi:murein DD-endopeptidase MepM/ murein hydrolase activator NlpD